MGKTKQPQVPKTPDYSTSVIKIGDDVVAKTYKDKSGAIISQITPTEAQSKLGSYVNKEIESLLPNIYGLNDVYTQSKNKILQASKNIADKAISDTYDPLYTELKNDIVSRFGNLSNSSFLDELDKLDENKAKAIADNSNDLVLLSSQLDDNERLKNIQYLQSLLNVNSNNNSIYQNYANSSGALSNNLNNFNNSNYQNQLSNYYTLLDKYNNSGILGSYTPLYLK